MLRVRQRPKAPTEPQPRRWTRKEYYRLLDLGFFRDQRVELIEGEIIEMPPMNNPHAIALGLAHDALAAAFGSGYWVRNQLPLHFGSHSEPEPDFAVVKGEPRDYQDHPTTALLVVEISDTSLQLDRGRKASLYARAGIEDYWIINLLDEQLEVYRDPQLESRRSRRYTYRKATVLKPGAVVKSLAAPNAGIAVSNLLP